MISPTGDYKICCFSGPEFERHKEFADGKHGVCVDENGKVMNVLTHSFLDALNSKYHKQLRLTQSKNERHTMCQMCWMREDADTAKGNPAFSLRHLRSFVQLHKEDGAITLEKAADVMKPDGSVGEYLISLDLRFTNVCNMKCIMCDSKYSNLWYEDEVKMGKKSFSYGKKMYNLFDVNGVIKSDNVPWHDSPIWWDQFDTIKHKVRHIYLTGGEPFIMKGHDVLLDKLIEADLAKNIILDYDSNLSVINQKILNKLLKFKEVSIGVSCDDIGERYELIRFPGKFETLEKNLKFLRDNNFKIRNLSNCTGIYSIFSPIRMYEHFSKQGYVKHSDYNFRLLRWPHEYDIGYLPKSVKEKALMIYEKSNLEQGWKEHMMGHLENTMNKCTEEESKKHLIKFVAYMDKLDEIRGTDWRKTFPDAVEILDGYI
jgi:hypothetical protein